jgi:hypothetical protein
VASTYWKQTLADIWLIYRGKRGAFLDYWWSEPQDVVPELRSAAMPAIGAADVHQFPDLKPDPALEGIQDRRLDPEVQVKIEVG